MSNCIKCGSYAFNLYKEGIDQGGLCDVHYWQGRAHRAEALAEQPAQRTWVGLKADELRVILGGDHTQISLALAIEAKLKEKNT